MLHIGICDDEKTTCTELETMLLQYAKEHGLDVDVKVWQTGEELCTFLEKEALDLLFLDIELVTTDGVTVGKYIREVLDNTDIMIVYISSKSSYAMSLFKVQPLDFLLKPLQQKEVWEVLDKGIRMAERKNECFEYETKGTHYKVPYKEIMYFYSQNKKVVIVTKNGEVEFNGKLKHLVPRVSKQFLLIHQSFLVNMDFVAECSYEHLKLQNGTELNISQPYRKKVREAVMAARWER